MNNSEIVVGMYEAFGRGDVQHILDQLSDDVQWDHGIRKMDVPYLQAGTGKAHVTEFFTALAGNLEFTKFEPAPPCVCDNTVMVSVLEAGRNVVTGEDVREEVVVHIWTFGPDGKVLSFRHVGDFATHEAAAHSLASTTA